MMLTERTSVAAAAIPVDEFRDHLRLGTGFADDSLQDDLLETCLRAAMTAIEARTGKALLVREMTCSVTAWRDLTRHTLPVAPVKRITQMRILDRHGEETVIDPDRYTLERDAHRPRLASRSLFLPAIPVGGVAEIEFEAGYAESWEALPADLKRATLTLGAVYYENRAAEGNANVGLPYPVASLIERYRNVRLFGGAA